MRALRWPSRGPQPLDTTQFMPPDRRLNATVSRTNHDCNLPRHADDLSSIDPTTGMLASPKLVVSCAECNAVWGVLVGKTEAHPDLRRVWFEKKSLVSRSYAGLLPHVVFDARTAYQRPDPHSIDWANQVPAKLDGFFWHQSDFVEMRGFGDGQCVSTKTVNIPMSPKLEVHDQLRCVLRTEHAGRHEAVSSTSGAFYAWDN